METGEIEGKSHITPQHPTITTKRRTDYSSESHNTRRFKMRPKGKAASGKGKSAPPPLEKGKKGAAPKGDKDKVPIGKKAPSGDSKAATSGADKQSKAARKLEREERERQRLSDRDDMMNGMPSYDDDEDHSQTQQYASMEVDFAGVSKKKMKDMTTDKFGNTVSKSKSRIIILHYYECAMIPCDHLIAMMCNVYCTIV